MSEITHTGTVTTVTKNTVTLSLSSDSCGSCSLRGVCGPASNQERTINVESSDAQSFVVGQKVEVTLSQSQAVNAAFWGYILPLILILSVVFGGTAAKNETFAAAAALGTIPVYYFILWLCRGKLKKTLQIKIR